MTPPVTPPSSQPNEQFSVLRPGKDVLVTLVSGKKANKAYREALASSQFISASQIDKEKFDPKTHDEKENDSECVIDKKTG